VTSIGIFDDGVNTKFYTVSKYLLTRRTGMNIVSP
jgi:hypothetical protein